MHLNVTEKKKLCITSFENKIIISSWNLLKRSFFESLLARLRPSYQRVLMKRRRACCVTPRFDLLLKAKSEVLLAFSCFPAATPLSGLLDQNKLKKALWTLSVFNLFPPLVLTVALFLSHSLPLFQSCSCFSKVYVLRGKKKRKLSISCTTRNLSLQLIQHHSHLPPAFNPL